MPVGAVVDVVGAVEAGATVERGGAETRAGDMAQPETTTTEARATSAGTRPWGPRGTPPLCHRGGW